VGGLGHFGILYAKALGADHVTAISRSHAKLEDAKKVRSRKQGLSDRSCTELTSKTGRCLLFYSYK